MAYRKPNLRKKARPFLWVALLWAVIGGAIAWNWSPASLQGAALGWFFLIWALVILDLSALALTLSAVLRLATPVPKNLRQRLIIQASTWGSLKLVSLGIFAAIFLSQRAIPTSGLLAGLATLAVVPVFGGLWLSLREVKQHA
jgi:hypothetical protein